MATIPGRLFRTLMIDRKAKKLTVNELVGMLRSNHQTLLEQVRAAPDNETNRRQLSHAIGIERWGQSRLRVALGDPLNMEEYNRYRPKREVAMEQLVEQFDTTRQETLAIAEELTAVSTNIGDNQIEHNMMGPMTVRSWLYYLDMHSNFELQKVA